MKEKKDSLWCIVDMRYSMLILDMRKNWAYLPSTSGSYGRKADKI